MILIIEDFRKFFKMYNRRLFYIGMILISVLRISILNGTPFNLTLQGYDDLLQIKNSVNLFNSNWLGTYTNITLPKNIGFPLFLAFSQYSQIPYTILYGLVITLSSFLFIKAIQPIIKNYGALLFLYTVIVFIPINHWGAYRIYRNALVPWVVLIIVSGFVGMLVRRNVSFHNYYIWSFISLLGIVYFWTLREDSIWILPFVIIAILSIILLSLSLFKKNKPQLLLRVIVTVLPLLGIVLSDVSISAMNYHYYGLYATNDRTKTYGAKLMSYLYKIDDGEYEKESSDVWASKKSIELAIASSPTLKTIEGPLLSSYSAWAGEDQINIKGDLVQWAVRSAMADKNAGFYQGNPVETNEFYKKVCEELEQSFESKQLQEKKGIYLSSQTGAFQMYDFYESFILSLRSSWKIINYQDSEIPEEYLFYDKLNETDLTYFQLLLKMPLPRTKSQLEALGINIEEAINNPDIVGTSDSLLFENDSIIKNRYSNFMLQKYIVTFYRFFVIFLLFFSLLGYCVIVKDLYKKGWKNNLRSLMIFLIVTGCMLSGFLNIYIVVLFSRWITRDPNSIIYGYYASSAYVFYTVALLVSCVYVFFKIKDIFQNKLHKRL